jgi:hypothetical protein
MGDLDPVLSQMDTLQSSLLIKFDEEMQRMHLSFEMAMTDERVQKNQNALFNLRKDFESFLSSLFITMKLNPTGVREWIQHFENYMTSAAARRGLGYIEFILI